LYELCYLAEFGKSVRHLRDYDGDIGSWWSDFRSRTAFTKPADEDLLMMLGISACFSAREDGTPQLPFDPHTGVLRPEVWQRWLDWDPVRMAPRYAQALRSLHAVWLDAGTRDEWYLDLGAQAFRDQLRAAGLPDERVHFELFDAGHSAIDYRYPLALACAVGSQTESLRRRCAQAVAELSDTRAGRQGCQDGVEDAQPVVRSGRRQHRPYP
jgi:hypothetical protein